MSVGDSAPLNKTWQHEYIFLAHVYNAIYINEFSKVELFLRLCTGNLQIDFPVFSKMDLKLCIKHCPHSHEFIFNVHAK